MGRPRVLLADDHALILDGYAKLLADEYEIVGKVSDGRALVAAVGRLNPDVAVLDVAMPLLNGIDAARQIHRERPLVRLVVVTMTEEPAIAAEAFRAGASAFLLKRSSGAELTMAIDEVLQGRHYVTPLIAGDLLDTLLSPQERHAGSDLSARQREILQLLAEGRSMKEVGAILSVTARTVAFHKYRMMQQLGVKSSAELIQYAVRHGIV